MEPMETWYRTLGLAPGASGAEIKRAYRTLAKRWHPDHCPTDAASQQQALAHFQRLTDAYHALRLHTLTPERPRAKAGALWPGQRRLWAALGLLCLLLGGLLGTRSPSSLPPPPQHPVLTSLPNPVEDVLPQRQYITVGSSKTDVRRIQGPPTVEMERLWEYHGSRVHFQGGRVTGWEIWPTAPLRVQLLARTPIIPVPTYFTRGSTKDEVLTVQGTPSRLTEHLWEYGASRVFFTDNRVSKWDEWPGAPLNARVDTQAVP